jgi:hypothetical protein
MVPMTAAAFGMAGVSLLLIVLTMRSRSLYEGARADRGRRTAMALGLVVMLIGARRIFFYAMEWTTGTDMLGLDPGETPGQMAFMTSVGFLLAGAALVVTARRGFYQVAQWLAAVVIFIGWIGMTRYFYGVKRRGVFPYGDAHGGVVRGAGHRDFLCTAGRRFHDGVEQRHGGGRARAQVVSRGVDRAGGGGRPAAARRAHGLVWVGDGADDFRDVQRPDFRGAALAHGEPAAPPGSGGGARRKRPCNRSSRYPAR